MKISGKEFKAFYNDDAYFDGMVFDEYSIKINANLISDGLDVDDIKDTDIIDIICGYLYNQENPESNANLVSFFKRWRKIQGKGMFVVSGKGTKLDLSKILRGTGFTVYE